MQLRLESAWVRRIPRSIYTYSVMAFVVAICILPILWVLMSSFKTTFEILGNPFTPPSSLRFGLMKYAELLVERAAWRPMWNSIYIALLATIFTLMIFGLAGYCFAKFRYRWVRVLFFLFVGGMLVPNHAQVQPIFAIVFQLGLYNSHGGLILVYTSFGIAISLFILRMAFMTIPKEVDEAAFIDGAGFVRVFWSINLPLARGGIATAGILNFLGYYNEYFYAAILLPSQRRRTMPVMLQDFTQQFTYDYTMMFAAIILAIIPGIIIYVLFTRQIQQSLGSSAIKG